MMFDGEPLMPTKQSKKKLPDEDIKSYNSGVVIIKIFDGLFLGNLNSFKELDFLSNNRVTFVINCSPKQIYLPTTNCHKIQVLDFNWQKHNGQLIEKINVSVIGQMISRIDSIRERGQSILIISNNGQTKSISLCIVYLMAKYSWNLYDCLEFINSKRNNLEVQAQYFQLLLEFQNTLQHHHIFSVFHNQQSHQDQLMLKNTFLNSQIKNMPNFYGFTYELDHNSIYQGNHNIHQHINQPKSVKFLVECEEVIQFNQDKSFTEDKGKIIKYSSLNKNQQIQKKDIKIVSIENNLKQFILTKFHGNEKNEFKMPKHNIDIKNSSSYQKKMKEQRGRRKALSKTEQSKKQYFDDEINLSFNDEVVKLQKDNEVVKLQSNNFIASPNFTQNHSIDLQFNREKCQTESSEIIAPHKNKQLHFNKKKKHIQKSITQQQVSQSYQHRGRFLKNHVNLFVDNDHQNQNHYKVASENKIKNTSGSTFKITKTSHRIKRTPSPMTNIDSSKQKKMTSEKCITSFQMQEFGREMTQNKVVNVNVNVNVKIQSINLIREYKKSNVEERFKVYLSEDKRKIHMKKAWQTKKIENNKRQLQKYG